MSIYFDAAFDYIMSFEGGLANNENDMGGITKYGISLRFLKSLSVEKLKEYSIFVQESPTEEDIVHLTSIQAKAIYFGEFWIRAPFDKINVDDVRNYLFHMTVNMGIGPATKCVQRAYWAIEGSRAALVDDGVMGNDTLEAINKGGTVIMYSLRSERAGYYRVIVEKNPTQMVFLEGWLNRAYTGMVGK